MIKEISRMWAEFRHPLRTVEQPRYICHEVSRDTYMTTSLLTQYEGKTVVEGFKHGGRYVLVVKNDC